MAEGYQTRQEIASPKISSLRFLNFWDFDTALGFCWHVLDHSQTEVVDLLAVSLVRVLEWRGAALGSPR